MKNAEVQMRVKAAVIVVVAAVMPWMAELWASSARIEWHAYEAGIARSRFEKKMAFIYFHAEWCAYCADMDRKTFTNPEVVAMLNRNFIPIRVDSDRDRAAASLYRVKGLPHMVFLTEGGREIGSLPGFIPPDQMMKALTAVLTATPK
jgi:thioredoxin-related protein